MSQQVTIVGRLGGDPEMKDTGKGVVLEGRVAVRSGREETTWWRFSLWGKRAEGLNGKIGKGCRVLVIGRMVIASRLIVLHAILTGVESGSCHTHIEKH